MKLNKERQAETEVQATTNADCTNVKPPYSQTPCCLLADFMVMDKKTVAVSRGGLPKGNYISVNDNDGRIVFTDLMAKKLDIEYGSTATFILPKENNGEAYLLIDDENGFMIRRQGKDRGSLLFMNKIVASNIHRYFKSEKSSIKLSVYPEQILINEEMQVWKVVCQRAAD